VKTFATETETRQQVALRYEHQHLFSYNLWYTIASAQTHHWEEILPYDHLVKNGPAWWMAKYPLP
jgi:hypothetical protein